MFLAAVLMLGLTACGRSAEVNWQEQYDLGVRYLSEGNYEEAIIAFTAAIEIDPNRAEAYVGRGDAYIGSGEIEDNLAAAQADYAAAIELDDTNVQAYLGLADVYIRRGEFEKAREVLETGLEMTGDQSISDKLAEFDSGNITDSFGISRLETSFDGEGNVLCYAVYGYMTGVHDITTYDQNWNQIAYGQMVQDEDGNVLEGYWIDSETGELGKIIWDYDENGNCIVYEDYNPEGSRNQRREFIYNDQNQVIQEYYYHEDDEQPQDCWKYTYDAAGNRIEEIACDLDGNPRYVSRRYSYDSNGNMIEELHYYGSDEDWGGRRVYDYDEYGNQISCTYWGPSGTVYYEVTSYEYDENGNIIGGRYESYRDGELELSSEW